jgi:glycosyltransferase involved in cell wall biosynthesis
MTQSELDVAELDVAVVIPCHQSGNFPAIAAATRSVDAQLYGSRISTVIAVDHNPALAQRLRAELPSVLVVENESGKRGAGPTRNAGAAAADAEFIAFLDDDELAEPDWLVQLLAPFSDPAVVGTGGRYLPNWLVGRPRWFPDELAWVVGGHHSGMPMHTTAVRNVWSGNMAVRASIFHVVDGFRTDFGKTGSRSRPEDTDLCIRMSARVPGGHWVYVPEARIQHSVPGDRSTFTFYLKRCYSEGGGKVELSANIDTAGTLDVERDYLRRTIPRGVRLHLRGGFWGLIRAGAIVCGIGAAGIGAGVSLLARLRPRVRRPEVPRT